MSVWKLKLPLTGIHFFWCGNNGLVIRLALSSVVLFGQRESTHPRYVLRKGTPINHNHYHNHACSYIFFHGECASSTYGSQIRFDVAHAHWQNKTTTINQSINRFWIALEWRSIWLGAEELTVILNARQVEGSQEAKPFDEQQQTLCKLLWALSAKWKDGE